MNHRIIESVKPSGTSDDAIMVMIQFWKGLIHENPRKSVAGFRVSMIQSPDDSMIQFD